ncbi:MAG: hypothetical protein ACFCD0_10985 [Gemmataceae bacterium]
MKQYIVSSLIFGMAFVLVGCKTNLPGSCSDGRCSGGLLRSPRVGGRVPLTRLPPEGITVPGPPTLPQGGMIQVQPPSSGQAGPIYTLPAPGGIPSKTWPQ